MFELLSNIVKAAVGIAVETPVAVVADVVTLGGTLTDRDETYTGEALSKVVKNIEDATK